MFCCSVVDQNVMFKLHGPSILAEDSRTRKGKGKAVPLQAWSGPEGSRKLRFPDFRMVVVNLTHWLPLPHLVLISVRG